MTTQRVDNSRIGGHNIQIGRVDGDLAIFLDRPGYRLELLEPRAIAHVPRSRRTPSYLLDARREIVPYRRRPDVEQHIRHWLHEDDEPASMVLIHAPGGHGKTRLAAHLATGAHTKGWTVAQAVPRTTTPDHIKPAETTDREGLLVVVDYAERWPLPVLVELVDDLVRRCGNHRLRILLLARPQAELWESIRAELTRSAIDLPAPIALTAYDAGPVDEMFNDAVAAFGQHLPELASNQAPIPVPHHLKSVQSPLTVHMTALAALCARYDDVPLPGLDDLSDFLLDHERRYWHADPADTSRIERMVLVACLFGPLDDTARARSWLRRAHLADGDAEAESLLGAHRRLYPPDASGTGHAVLPPLRPDRFAEDFLAAQLSRPHTTELLTELFGHATPAETRQGLIMLAATANRHTSPRAAFFALAAGPAASHAGAPVVAAVVRHATLDQAIAVLDALPEQSVELLRPRRDLAERIVRELPSDATPEVRAAQLRKLGASRAAAGDRKGALDAALEAVRIHSEAPPSESRIHEYALALESLGNRLAEVGDRQLALHMTSLAAARYAQLIEIDPRRIPDYATALYYLGNHLSATGDRTTALKATQRATDLFRIMAEVNPTFRPLLAAALTDLGNRRFETGDPQGAVESAREAMSIHRMPAEAEPGAYLPNLAGALSNLGSALSKVGDFRAALDHAREATAIHRTLAEEEPDAYRPHLAKSLNNLGLRLSNVGDPQGAVEATREAVAILRILAQAEPDAFLPDLATSLINLGGRLRDVGEQFAALEAAREAVTISRTLAEAEPDAFIPYLGRSLINFGLFLADIGAVDSALESLQEAVAIIRALTEAEPRTYLPLLALSLFNWGTVLATSRDTLAAINVTRESIEIIRPLAETEPAGHLADLARSLISLGNYLTTAGDHLAAREARREVLSITRTLAETDRAACLRSLAHSLLSYLRSCESSSELRAATVELIEVYKEMNQQFPGRYHNSLAKAHFILHLVGKPDR
ncbi:tetratricopeptide repeat protein [Acrocarpospora catenulata]|uniref:tetratricopeptide repeat protein n=1 Tax=Acrocarpospora catenulata TaxID=2836182 RepID=UPI001BD97CE3|nr:tetratricopeptide repeat protein [Acrocarpospora catenulata]